MQPRSKMVDVTQPGNVGHPRGKVIGAILAGGAGRRLGGIDKGLHMLAGRALIEHVTKAMYAQVDELLIVANRHRGDYARFAPVIADAQPGHAGPLAGLAVALTHADTEHLLSVPVDCPRPPPDLCARLRQALTSHTRARCAVAFDGTRRQPLFALYRPHLGATAMQALRDDSPVWRWQQDLGATHADFSDSAGAFLNLNTASDFARYEHGHV